MTDANGWTQKETTLRALTFFNRYSDEGDKFLNKTGTGDETWVSHVTPETKEQSMKWGHSGPT